MAQKEESKLDLKLRTLKMRDKIAIIIGNF